MGWGFTRQPVGKKLSLLSAGCPVSNRDFVSQRQFYSRLACISTLLWDVSWLAVSLTSLCQSESVAMTSRMWPWHSSAILHRCVKTSERSVCKSSHMLYPGVGTMASKLHHALSRNFAMNINILLKLTEECKSTIKSFPGGTYPGNRLNYNMTTKVI